MASADHRISSHSATHVNAIKRLTSPGSVIDDNGMRAVYSGDAQNRYSDLPMAVVLPRSTDEIASVLRYCRDAGVKVFPRGGGTSMVGGAVPAPDGVVVCLSRMNRVLAFDRDSQLVRVEAGITTGAVSEAIRAKGFRYLPDPASAMASTIAGNIATAASGARALCCGGTMTHVCGVRVVLMDGEVIEVGAGFLDAPGYDLLGLIGGSEGQFGIVTEASLRIAPIPPAAETLVMGFGGTVAAAQCLAGIVASGIHPARSAVLEQAAVKAIGRHEAAGLPDDAAAVLMVEVEGTTDECAAWLAWLEDIARPFEPKVVRRTSGPAQSALMWQAQRSAYAAIGQISGYLCAEGVVPVSRLAGCVKHIAEIAKADGLKTVSVMQGGDGRITPFILHDGDAIERAERVQAAILAHYVEVGGSIAGELGIGLEKRELMPLQFTEADLSLQAQLRAAIDPSGLLNPGKVLPRSDISPTPSDQGYLRRWASGRSR
jgi:glycolate oxidase